MIKQKNISSIIAGCRKQNPASQKALLTMYADKLYAVSLRYVRDQHQAQEVVQDTFIKIFKSIDNFDEQKGNMEAYLRKIAIRFALKRLNKKKIPVDILEEHIQNHVSMPPEAIEQLERDDLLELIRTLPDGYRQVFNLYVIEGYSHKEIGDMIGIKEVSSRSNLSRAKIILRKKLLDLKPYKSWAKVY